MFVKFFSGGADVAAMTYENLDARLINALLDDGRASLRSLGEQLDVSVTTVSNHLRDLEGEGVIEGYTPKVNYQKLGYDVTAVLQLKVEGSALPEITDRLTELRGMISVYEVTGDHDVVAVAKFEDTDDMNERIKRILVDDDIRESNTSVVLNAVAENQQFDLKIDEE
ncbi:transcriptional regulator, AsnC family [halophilic archaeon DL31]|jgi:DNA-binding Lrp family transcriptional regulator|nr:transcriptional regulator, AsnC family [halophilic archaeon DL31]